jgi:hypothetical protein
MSYTRFDRHEYMGAETRSEIMDTIREIGDDDYSRNLENMMYGLFDGYLYAEIQIEALQLPTELASKVMRIFDICNHYPKYEPQTNY